MSVRSAAEPVVTLGAPESSGGGNVPKATVVGDALWFGVCKPQPEPVEMPEIY